MFEDKLGVSLTKVLGMAAVAPKSDGVAKLLDAQDVVLRHNSKRTENSALPCRDGCPI